SITPSVTSVTALVTLSLGSTTVTVTSFDVASLYSEVAVNTLLSSVPSALSESLSTSALNSIVIVLSPLNGGGFVTSPISNVTFWPSTPTAFGNGIVAPTASVRSELSNPRLPPTALMVTLLSAWGRNSMPSGSLSLKVRSRVSPAGTVTVSE